MIVFCVFAGVWSFCVHVRNDYKKQKTKQTNLGCAFVFLFMHECITAYPCLCWSKVKQLYFGPEHQLHQMSTVEEARSCLQCLCMKLD